MKTKLSIALVLLMGLFASCTPVVERVYENTASHDIAGEFEGEWTLVKNPTSEHPDTSFLLGTIAFTQIDTLAYVANITVTTQDGTVRTDVCNVSHANDGLVFYNNAGTTFGTKFRGEVLADGTITMGYEMQVQDGRKKILTNYSFLGARK